MTALATGARLVVLAAAMLGAAAAPALAETLTFKADLLPVAGTNSTATGVLTADYDTDSKKLTWRGSYSGIGTYATAANFYGPGNAVVVRLRSFDSPFDGTAILADKQASNLIGGQWFVLIRTAAHADGELRGQVTRAN